MKTVYALSAALVISLGAAWYTHKSPDIEEKQGSFEVYRANQKNINSVSWEDEKQTITISQRSDRLGDYIWVEAVDKIQASEQTPEEDSPVTEAEQPKEKRVSFLGNAAAQKLYADFAPLKALRSLDDVPKNTGDIFGFSTPTATLTIDKEIPVSIIIGGSTFGSKDRYARSDDKTFLLSDATLRPLEFGKMRLVERQLHPLAEPQLTEIKVKKSEGGDITFKQHNADDPAKSYWSLADDEAQADVEASWIAKLLRLRTQAYKDRRDVPKNLKSVLTVTMRSASTSYTFELLHDQNEDTYYAQSAYNRSMVTVTKSIATDIARDLSGLF